MKLPIQDILDCERYPILESANASDFFAEAGARFRQDGLLSLPNFVKKDALDLMIKEADKLAEGAFYNAVTGNAYLEKENESFPKDHAHRMVETTTLGVVANDQIDDSTYLRAIYASPEVRTFIEKLLGRGQLYEYACRLGALNLSVMKEDHYLRWHFDQADFVVSLNIQEAETGGEYQYVSNLRTKDDPCYDAVKEVLQGDHSKVKRLFTPPGSLILFEGRYTLHRVTTIGGKRNRYTALFGYGLEPNIDSTDYLKMIRYGRTK